jgi:hypothetical protein
MADPKSVSTRKPNAALMNAGPTREALAKIVGSEPLPVEN